jgi:hypothetical protein
MSLRRSAVSVIALAVLVVGCSDRVDRALGPSWPSVLASQTYQQNEMVHWTQALVPPDDWRGEALDLFNAIRGAEDQNAAGHALLAFLFEAYEAGATAVPARTTLEPTLENAILEYMWAVASFYGLVLDMPQPGDIDPILEHTIQLVTEGKFQDEDDEVCFPTDKAPLGQSVGNAAMCLKKSSLNYPTWVALVEDPASFPTPGFEKQGKTFKYEVYGNLAEGGAGVLVVLCAPPGHAHNEPFVFLRGGDHPGGPFAPTPDESPAHTCPPETASLMKGDGLFARGVNTLGSFIMSAVSPRPAYASHNLAHREFSSLSPWTLATPEDNFTVRYVRTVPAPHTTTKAIFKRNGGFVFWVEVSNNGVPYTACDPDNRPHQGIDARTITESNIGGNFIPSLDCEAVTDLLGVNTAGYKFELPNPINGTSHKGEIEFRINGFGILPGRLEYETVR